MKFSTDDHLNQFKAQSDRAFKEMLDKADREMATFLKSYDRHSSGTGFEVGPPTSPRAASSMPKIRPALGAVKDNVSEFLEAGEDLIEKVTGVDVPSMYGEAVSDSVDDLRTDFVALRQGTRKSLEETAQEALKGTKDILKGASMDLGARAKQEAAAMREAAQRVMKEEKSLKGLKERAKAEFQQAKSRLKDQMQDAKEDLMEDFEGMAREKGEKLQKQGLAQAQFAHDLCRPRD